MGGGPLAGAMAAILSAGREPGQGGGGMRAGTAGTLHHWDKVTASTWTAPLGPSPVPEVSISVQCSPLLGPCVCPHRE